VDNGYRCGACLLKQKRGKDLKLAIQDLEAHRSMQNLTETETVQYSMETPEVAHLAGVFDAGGNITVEIAPNQSQRINYTYRPTLQISLSTDDEPLLGKLVAFCDEYRIKYNLKENDSTTRLIIRDKGSIERFLEELSPYLVTTYEDARIMLQIVLPAVRNGDHRSKDGFYQLMKMADRLRESNKTRSNVKYDQEYFAEEWSLPE